MEEIEWAERLKTLFEAEEERGEDGNVLEGHAITKEQRMKMVDWMIEVCHCFRCSERTYHLAVALFDKFMRRAKGKMILYNHNVHVMGIVAMYLASKYEDIIPINSVTFSDKISHNQISQKEILNIEHEFLTNLNFDLEVVTPYDFHIYFFHIIKSKMEPMERVEADVFSKIKELSILIISMAL